MKNPSRRFLITCPTSGPADLNINAAMVAADAKPCVFALEDSREYLVESTTLSLVNNQHIQGNNATLKRKPGDGETIAPMVTLGGGSTVRDVTLFGSGKHVGLGLMITNGVARWAVERVRVVHFEVGAKLDGTWIGSMRDCMLSSNRVGILIEGQNVNEIRVEGGEIAGNGDSGVEIGGMNHQGLTFKTCIEGNKECGVRIIGAVTQARFVDCYFEFNGLTGIIQIGNAACATIIERCLFIRERLPILIDAGMEAYIGGCTFMALPAGSVPWKIGPEAIGCCIGWNNLASQRGKIRVDDLANSLQRDKRFIGQSDTWQQTYK